MSQIAINVPHHLCYLCAINQYVVTHINKKIVHIFERLRALSENHHALKETWF